MIHDHEPPLDWTLIQLADEVEYWLGQILRTVNWFEHTNADPHRYDRRDRRWWESEMYELTKTTWRILNRLPVELRELGDSGLLRGRPLARKLDEVFTEVLNIVHLFEVRGYGPWFWHSGVRDAWEARFIGQFREFWRLLTGVPDQLRTLSEPSQEDQEYGILDLEYLDLTELEVDFTSLAGEPGDLPHIAQMEMESRSICVTISQWPGENYVLRRAWKPLQIDLGTRDYEKATELTTKLLVLGKLFPAPTEWWRSLSAAALRYFPDPKPDARVRIVRPTR